MLFSGCGGWVFRNGIYPAKNGGFIVKWKVVVGRGWGGGVNCIQISFPRNKKIRRCEVREEEKKERVYNYGR